MILNTNHTMTSLFGKQGMQVVERSAYTVPVKSLHYCSLLKKIFILFIALFSMQVLPAQTDSTFHLYLLFGQSNMAGRGKVTDEFKNQGSANLLMLDKENHWVQAKHPLHFDKPAIVGVGPGLSFGLKMAKKNKGQKIGLIPCAVGGTSIDLWKPAAYDSATKTHPYDDMLKRLKEAMRYGDIKGMIWLQGEADSNSEKAKNYLDKLQELINKIRMITNNPSLPIVAGELGRYKQQYQHINNELAKLPGRVTYTAVASSKGFTDIGDSTHFNSAAADKYGVRFAKKMKRLQRRLRK